MHSCHSGRHACKGSHTSKVRSICQLHLFVGLGDHAGDTMLDEVHLLPHGALSDDVVVGLKDLELQLAEHPRHKVWVCVCEQRHGGHQLATVEVDNFLLGDQREKPSYDWDGQTNEPEHTKNPQPEHIICAALIHGNK